MRAATFSADDGRLRIEDVPAPVPEAGEAVLRVRACGICGTDLHATAIRGLVRDGAILGHELAGEIVALGGGDPEGWALGERVFSLPFASCGGCTPCLRGATELCEDRHDLGELLPGDWPGAYAELVRVGLRDLVRLPAGVAFAHAALLEPLCTGLRSVRLACLRPGDSTLVLGGGPIGLAVVHLCANQGVRRITLSEPNQTRRELGLHLGATSVLDPAEVADLGAAYRELNGDDPDVVFEAVGRLGMLGQAVELVRIQGTVVAVGVCLEPDPFDHVAAYTKEVTIRVPHYYSLADARYLVDLLEQGRIDASAIVSGRIALDRLPATFDALRAGGSADVKVIVTP